MDLGIHGWPDVVGIVGCGIAIWEFCSRWRKSRLRLRIRCEPKQRNLMLWVDHRGGPRLVINEVRLVVESVRYDGDANFKGDVVPQKEHREMPKGLSVYGTEPGKPIVSAGESYPMVFQITTNEPWELVPIRAKRFARIEVVSQGDVVKSVDVSEEMRPLVEDGAEWRRGNGRWLREPVWQTARE